MTDKEKKPRGRPVKNEIKPIPDTAKNIAKAILFAPHKKIAKPTNKSDK